MQTLETERSEKKCVGTYIKFKVFRIQNRTFWGKQKKLQMLLHPCMVGKGDDLGVLSGGFKHYARELEQERRAPCLPYHFVDSA